MTTMKGLRVLGKQTSANDYSKDWRALDVLDAPTESVTFHCDEITALCPMTRMQDIYAGEILLYVRGVTIESKGLRMLLGAFSTDEIFAEHLAAKFAVIVASAIANAEPESDLDQLVEVRLRQRSRGGISIEATATCTLERARSLHIGVDGEDWTGRLTEANEDAHRLPNHIT